MKTPTEQLKEEMDRADPSAFAADAIKEALSDIGYEFDREYGLSVEEGNKIIRKALLIYALEHND